MHQQEESGQVSNSAGERDQDPEGERPSADVRLVPWTRVDVCLFLQELKHDNIVALLDFQVRRHQLTPESSWCSMVASSCHVCSD